MTEEKKVYVWYYDHDCDYISKYCDVYHQVGALVPVSVLAEYIIRDPEIDRYLDGEGR